MPTYLDSFVSHLNCHIHRIGWWENCNRKALDYLYLTVKTHGFPVNFPIFDGKTHGFPVNFPIFDGKTHGFPVDFPIFDGKNHGFPAKIFPTNPIHCHIFSELSEESSPAAPEDLHQGAWPKRGAAAALLPPRRQRRQRRRRRCGRRGGRRGGECRGRGGGERFLESADWISNSIDIHRYMMRYLSLCDVFD